MILPSGRPPRLTNRQLLESLATRPLPQPFDHQIRALLDTTNAMRSAAHALGINRRFTLDGRLLGDLGEVIARIHFGIDLHDVQQEGQDGTCSVSGRCVELKLRSAANLVFVKRIPDILVVVYLSPESLKWGVVCNGPGEPLLADAAWDPDAKRYCSTLAKLRRANLSLPPGSLSLSERVRSD